VLYVTGFFSDHLQTRGVELGYVSSLGARAYDSASSMLRRAVGTPDTRAPDVFRELADNFNMFTALLARVADALFANSVRSESAVLKLYERWLRTGSTSLATALAARGMLAIRGDGTLH